MKVSKIKKTNNIQSEVVNEQYSIKQLIIITLIISILFLIFYFISTFFVHQTNQTTSNNSITVFDSDTILMSQILTRNDSEYYVLATKENENDLYVDADYNDLYNNYIKKYKSNNENYIKFYKVNLSDAMNSKFLSDTINIEDNVLNIRVTDDTLFKVNNGKIVEYYSGNKEIINILSNL